MIGGVEEKNKAFGSRIRTRKPSQLASVIPFHFIVKWKYNLGNSREFSMTVGAQSQTAQEYLDAGNSLYAQKKYDEAIGKFQKAVELKPDFADAYYNWGTALHAQSKYDVAIGKYQKAVEVKSDHANAYNNWGTALHVQGKHEEAIGK